MYLPCNLASKLVVYHGKINISIPVSIHGGSRNLSAIPNCQQKNKMLSTNWPFQLAGSLHSFHHAYVYMNICSNIYIYKSYEHTFNYMQYVLYYIYTYIHLNDPE